jgi:hypothetical protein
MLQPARHPDRRDGRKHERVDVRHAQHIETAGSGTTTTLADEVAFISRPPLEGLGTFEGVRPSQSRSRHQRYPEIPGVSPGTLDATRFSGSLSGIGALRITNFLVIGLG